MNCVTVCTGQICRVDLRCDHCKEWSVGKWSVVQAHHIDKLQEQHEEERMVMSKSLSSSFSRFGVEIILSTFDFTFFFILLLLIYQYKFVYSIIIFDSICAFCISIP